LFHCNNNIITTMEPFGVKAIALATAMSSMLSMRAYKKKSLTTGGSIAAFSVAFLLVGSGLRGLNLLTFYFVSMKATKYKKELKAKIDGTIASNEGSTSRGTSQVLACSLVATVLSVFHVLYCGAEKPVKFDEDMLSSQLTCGIVAHHATCLADTLASEMGILSKTSPRLITKPWKQVPSGTNGGVTLNGFFWSAMGGFIIGLSTVCFDMMSGIPTNSLQMLSFSTACGLVGSILDSILGATVQQSYFDPDTKLVYQEEDKRPKTASLVVNSMNLLSNELVNLVSVVATTIFGGWVLGPLFF